ncbi:MAG: CRTAC1 family protein, partial [Phycisphaerales bacterium]|nr:CRTAC1 family protein [Phycisphaerales bacterium]
FDAARDHLLTLQEQGVLQDEQAMGLFNGALVQIDNEKARVARAQVIGLDNVLKPTRAWQHSQLEVAGPPGTVGHPIREFVNTVVPKPSAPTAKEVSFTKDEESVEPPNKKHVVLVESPEQIEVVEVDDSFVLVTTPIDWNNDRKVDVIYGTTKGKIAIEGGDILIEENGTPIKALTPWDADQDGDLDLLVSRDSTFLLQNNGDGSATIVELDTPLLHATHIIDIDEDGAVDVVGIDKNGKLVLLKNERSGKIVPVHDLLPNIILSDLTVADFNNDGWMDIAYIDNGSAFIAENNHEIGFEIRKVGGFALQIAAADIDNDTKQDIILSGEQIDILFANGNTASIDAIGDVQIVDADLDGDLDIATQGTEFAIWHQDGTPKENEFQKIILEAILEGGQRNNALAVGGFVEVRSNGAYQKHLITGPLTHIGLGGKPADAIRVVWPNGVPQEVIEPKPNQVFTEVQILKGSCPFLATSTDDGSWEFVTDLLWRSPLGLKINAQTVPPIAATQDWVKVRGDQLVPRNGVYELAITAQLWETHFIDEVKMIAVDHPLGTEVFVDERFVAPVPPEYTLYAYEQLRTPDGAIDQHGNDVLETIRVRDGNRLGGFAKGPYQGVGEEHFVELDLGALDSNQAVDVIAQGWIRPTDTSINVASAQNKSAPIPSGIRVDVPNGKGSWKTVIPNGGFPAGKLKTIVLEIPAGSFESNDFRVRIATNLEIYWDKISYAEKSNVKTIRTPIELVSADLGYMGFPVMSRANDDAPNIPDYKDILHGNAWRDLEGYYTRYGAVEELLTKVDDRYVIMNAGDAMYLQFDEPEQEVADGFTRDYIFFCDGWVKDGDWNTVDSRTVGPLPHHAMTGYPYPEDERPPELLPSHPDWQEFHTRYITPASFRDAVK